MVVRELITKFGFKTDNAAVEGYEKKVLSAKQATLALTAAVTAATTAIFAFVNSAAKAGDTLDKVRDTVGLTAKQYQLLSGAAALSGIEQDNFRVSMQFFMRSLGMARQGMQMQIRALNMLHVSLRDNNGQMKSQAQLLSEVADNFGNLRNQSDKAFVTQTLFGRSGTGMINMLKGGSAGLKEMTDRVAKYGFLLDEKAIKASVKFRDTTFLLKYAITSIKNEIGIGLLPVMQKMIDSMLKWIAANKQIIASRIEQFFRAMLIVAKGFQLAITTIVRAFEGFLHLINMMPAPIAALLKGLIALKLVLTVISAKSLIILGLFSALVLIFDDINAFLQGKDSMLGRFAKNFPRFFRFMVDTLKVIKAELWLITEPLRLIVQFIAEIEMFIDKTRRHGWGKVGKFFESPLGKLAQFQPLALPVTTAAHLAKAGGFVFNNNTTVNMALPHGTTDAHKNIVSKAAKDIFHSHFTDEIRKAFNFFPRTEK